MENATEALHMGFGVLIFVLALSICISIFSQVRATSQYIIEAKDRENDYIYVEQSGTKRIVGAETIVPAMYRALKEEYVIMFEGIDGRVPNVLFEKKKNQTEYENVYALSLKSLDLQANSQKDDQASKFMDEFLNGTLGNEGSNFPNMRKPENWRLQKGGFYDKIKGHIFEETLGIYYMEDVVSSNPEEAEEILSSDANKTEIRVITYKLKK